MSRPYILEYSIDRLGNTANEHGLNDKRQIEFPSLEACKAYTRGLTLGLHHGKQGEGLTSFAYWSKKT